MKKSLNIVAALVVTTVIYSPLYAESGSSGIIRITDFSAREIPMYRRPGAEAFNYLVFTQKEFEVYNSDTGKQKACEYSTKHPYLLYVYDVQGGQEAAQQSANNQYYHSDGPMPELWPDVPGTEHILELAVADVPVGQWLQVVPYIASGNGCYYESKVPPGHGDCPLDLEGVRHSGMYAIPTPFYIRYDAEYMLFVPWADVITEKRTFHLNPETTVYDSFEGRPLVKPLEVYYGELSGELHGDWAPVRLFARPDEADEKAFQGWLRWRDENGLAIAPREMHVGGFLE